jgi:hypothetical protein
MSWCLPCASLHHSLSSKTKKHAACLMEVSDSSSVRSKGLLCIIKSTRCLSIVHLARAPVLSAGFLAWDSLHR